MAKGNKSWTISFEAISRTVLSWLLFTFSLFLTHIFSRFSFGLLKYPFKSDFKAVLNAITKRVTLDSICRNAMYVCFTLWGFLVWGEIFPTQWRNTLNNILHCVAYTCGDFIRICLLYVRTNERNLSRSFVRTFDWWYSRYKIEQWMVAHNLNNDWKFKRQIKPLTRQRYMVADGEWQHFWPTQTHAINFESNRLKLIHLKVSLLPFSFIVNTLVEKKNCQGRRSGLGY